MKFENKTEEAKSKFNTVKDDPFDKSVDDTSTQRNMKSAKVAPEPIASNKKVPRDNIDAIENIFVVDQKCIMRVNDPNRIRWDLFVMSLATWN
jgi:hypothetical protein